MNRISTFKITIKNRKWVEAMTEIKTKAIGLSSLLTVIAIAFSSSLMAKDLPGSSKTSYGVSSSGAFQYQIPIVTPAGVNGVQPSLSLSFSSSGGNGSVGTGWGVSGLGSISRCGRTIAVDGIKGGVLHDSNDKFCLNGKRLIKVSGGAYGSANSEYRTEIDSFVKVVAKGAVTNVVSGSSPKYWEVWHKDGTISEYGGTTDSRFSLADDVSFPTNGNNLILSGGIHAWRLSKVRDRSNNNYIVTYTEKYRLPHQIIYSGGHKVKFNYQTKSDVRSSYILGKKFTFDKRLSSIVVSKGASTVRKYDLEYRYAPATKKSQLVSVTECGINNDCLTPTNIEWASESAGFNSTTTANEVKAPEALIEHYNYQQYYAQGQTDTATKEINRGVWADVNNDGKLDLVIAYITPDGIQVVKTYIKKGTGWELHKAGGSKSTWQLPRPLRSYDNSVTNMSTARFKSEVINQGQLIDVNGDGLVDVVYAYKLDRELHQYKDPSSGSVSQIEDVKVTYLNTGNGWQESAAYKPKDYLFDYYATRMVFGHVGRPVTKGRFVDINGDGLVDWITSFHYRQQSWNSRKQTWLNTGSGWALSSAYQPPSYLNEYYGAHSWTRAELVDVNGDGLRDWVEAYRVYWDNNYRLISNVWLNTGSSFMSTTSSTYRLTEPIYDNNGKTYSAVKRGSFVDVNGDGLSDFVRSFIAWNHANVQQATLINNGNGWVADANYKPAFVHLDYTYIGHTGQSGTDRGPGWGMQTRGYYIDVNRDGLVDFVQSYKDIKHPAQTHMTTWRNDGKKWVVDNSLNPNRLFFDYSGRGKSKARSGWFADINSDGSPDWVNGHNTSVSTNLNKLSNPNSLVKITTTLGIEVKPTFKPLTDTAVYQRAAGAPLAKSRHLVGPMYVTSKLSVTNANGTNNVTNYQYENGQVHRERGFLGFKTLTSVAQASGLTSITDYRQDYPYTGLVSRSIVKETGVASPYLWISINNNTYSWRPLNGGKTKFVYPVINKHRNKELTTNGSGQYRWVESKSAFDDYGNVLSQTIKQGSNHNAILLTSIINNTYKPADTTNWLVGRLAATTTSKTEPGGASKTNKVRYDYVAGKPWLVSSMIREPDSSDVKVKLKTAYTYDVYGNVLSETTESFDTSDPNRIRTSSVGYDSQHRLPISTTNALGHRASLTYHPLCDQPKTVNDINGLVTRYEYDNFCRQTKVTDPIGVSETTTYDFSAQSCTNCAYKVETKRDGETPQISYFNAYSQTVMSQATGMMPTQIIRQQVEYDNLGRTTRQSQPYFTGDTVYWTQSSYDVTGRVTKTVLPFNGSANVESNGKARITYAYRVVGGKQQRTTTDTLNHTKTVFANALGQIAEVKDAKNTSLVYDYDANGSLIQTNVVGQSNTTITVGYDALGRRTSLNDPDLGLSTFEYDAFGQIKSQTDAKGNTLSMTYDKLGRLTHRTVPNNNGVGTETSFWTYDTNLSSDPSSKALGSVSLIRRGTRERFNERRFVYDQYGRPSAKETFIRGERFTEAYTYNALGYLSGRAYPSSGSIVAVGDGDDVEIHRPLNFMVAYEYQNGYLKEISGVDHLGKKCISHWKADQYDALGRTKIDTLGDIVTTTYGYDQAQGVLRTINAVITKGTDSGNTVQNLSYNYDAGNNLTSRADAVTSVTETFSFDELDRLRFHNRTANGTTDTVEVRYDAIGNITYKSDVGSYQYNSSKVHAVTRVNAPTTSAVLNPLAKFTVDWEWNGEKVTQAQPNIHNTDYQYDANGNIQQQGDRRFYWTAFDKPHTMTRKDGNVYRGSVIDYNADFNRSYKQEAIFNSLGVKQQVKETTYYVGKEYEKIVNAQGIKHRYTIATGGGTVQIERDHNTDHDKPKYMLTDNLGSTNVILNGLAQIEQRLEFDPWGMRMAGPQVGTVNSITNKGYTGHEMDDEVGVINMNARIYDPYLGRFLSADPILPDAGDLQQYNRYSYTIGNPLKYTDPSGHCSEPHYGCGRRDGGSYRENFAGSSGGSAMFLGGGPDRGGYGAYGGGGSFIEPESDDDSVEPETDDNEPFEDIEQGDTKEPGKAKKKSYKPEDVNKNLTKKQLRQIEKIKKKLITLIEKNQKLINRALQGDKKALRKLMRYFGAKTFAQIERIGFDLSKARFLLMSDKIKFGFFTSSYILRRRLEEGFSAKYRAGGPMIGAGADAKNGWIFFNPRSVTVGVFAHELGHHIGKGDYRGIDGKIIYGYDRAIRDAFHRRFGSAIHNASNFGCFIGGGTDVRINNC